MGGSCSVPTPATEIAPHVHGPNRDAHSRTGHRSAASPLAGVATVGELLRRLGNVPAWRVRWQPFPGTATEKDVIRILDKENRPCELVEGTLVEKVMGYEEAEIAGLLITFLNNFVLPRRLGVVVAADGTVRLFPGLVRNPGRGVRVVGEVPGREAPKAAIPELAPDLAVEVISKGNTKAEMARKLGEYFRAGVRLVWIGRAEDPYRPRLHGCGSVHGVEAGPDARRRRRAAGIHGPGR